MGVHCHTAIWLPFSDADAMTPPSDLHLVVRSVSHRIARFNIGRLCDGSSGWVHSGSCWVVGEGGGSVHSGTKGLTMSPNIHSRNHDMYDYGYCVLRQLLG